MRKRNEARKKKVFRCVNVCERAGIRARSRLVVAVAREDLEKEIRKV